MFVTVHAAAATIIGKKINNSIIAFILGLLSHFILDIIPHGDENLGKKFLGINIKTKEDFRILALYGSIDSCLLAIFLIFLFKNFSFATGDSVIWAIIGGILPDVLVAFYKITNLKILKPISDIHRKNHSWLIKKIKTDVPLKYGILMQVALMGLIIWIIYTI